MKIQTKYEIGDKVWVVYANRGEACVFDDYISEIYINENGLFYMLKKDCVDHKEEDIILYEDEETLVSKIKQIMREVTKKKESEEK